MQEFNTWLVGGGFAVGIIFGILIQRSRFCMVAAVSNWMLIKDTRQVMAFIAAYIVAIGGTQYLEISEWVAIADSSYRNSQFDWFGVIFGGLIFGCGATLAGGCAARTVVRTAEGNMQSLLALVSFMLVAAITQFGFLEGPRISLTEITATTLTTDAGIASILSVSSTVLASVVVIGLIVALVFFIRRAGSENVSWPMIISGTVIGALVVASWIITGDLAQDEFDPRHPSAMTVSGPMARFGYIILSGSIPTLSFAISFVIGVAVASFVTALVTRTFKITPIQTGMAKFAVLGGSLMGIGGILAYGCNVGQGLSGMSTLSVESLLAVGSMFMGVVITTKWWESRTA